MEQKYLIGIGLMVSACIVGFFIYAAIIKETPWVQNSSLVPSAEPAPVSLQSNQTACRAVRQSVVTKVIDGDTVVVEGGYHVRLLGIDADEKNYPCYTPAKERLEVLVLNKEVTLEKDTTDVDQYGRCLRTLFLFGQNIDLELVKEGLAIARFYEPDIKYQQEISGAEAQAIKNKTGCKWSHDK